MMMNENFVLLIVGCHETWTYGHQMAGWVERFPEPGQQLCMACSPW